MLYFKLAWRNIWRNKRRTFLTVLSILVAVVLSVFTRSMQLGSYNNMVDNIAGKFNGYIQIQQKDYWEERSLENTFEGSDSLKKVIGQYEAVTAVAPRLESYVLIAGQEKSRASIVVGVDPQTEKHLINPASILQKGENLQSSDQNGVLISSGLARYLDLHVHDSVVALGQGYHAINAVGKYPVKGIVKFGNPEINRSTVILPIHTARELFGAHNRLTAYALAIDKAGNTEKTEQAIAHDLPAAYAVMSWKEMMPEVVQTIEVDNIGGWIMLFVLYMMVGFGIFGTVLMMTSERQYEFGMLISIGLKRVRVGIMLLYETLFIALLGVFSGVLLSFPVVLYFYYNPIPLTGQMAKGIEDMGFEPVIPFALNASIFWNQALIIVAMVAIVGLYPLWYTARLKVIEAIRS